MAKKATKKVDNKSLTPGWEDFEIPELDWDISELDFEVPDIPELDFIIETCPTCGQWTIKTSDKQASKKVNKSR